MRVITARLPRLLLVAAAVVAAACMVPDRKAGQRQRWWAGLGPVLPHETFPADCSLCHTGAGWNDLRTDFYYDHELETGVKLVGAHEEAQCLRCHNDRGPVGIFMARGCVGCHDDIHQGDLGTQCTTCHTEVTWVPYGQIEMHNRTRFPLTGAHVSTACHKCHPGAFTGNFAPTDTECLTCHYVDLTRATNPPHLLFGYTTRCDRCHLTTDWNNAEIK